MTKVLLAALLLCSSIAFAADPPPADGTPDRPAQKITLAEVPPEVLASARKAKPYVYFKSAERMEWDDHLVYRLKGVVNRVDWDVYLNNTGNVIKIESDERGD